MGSETFYWDGLSNSLNIFSYSRKTWSKLLFEFFLHVSARAVNQRILHFVYIEIIRQRFVLTRKPNISALVKLCISFDF